MHSQANQHTGNILNSHVSVRYFKLGGIGTSGRLPSCSGLEFNYKFGGYPSAVFDVDALGLGPLVDFGGVQGARLRFAPAAGWPPGAGADAAGGGHIACQSVPQLLGVLGVQVDLVLGAVEAEPDSAFGLAAVEVVDEEGLDLLGYDCCSVPVVPSDASA
jgi:hypothetical protein